MSSRLYLNACGLVTGFGGTAATAAGVFAGAETALGWREDLLAGRRVLVGSVRAALPEMPAGLEAFASRNNRMMLAAFGEIAGALAAARRRFGARRIAVLLGTSTGGIAEGEEALDRVEAGEGWPEGYDYRMQELGGLAEAAAGALDLDGPAYTVGAACASSAKVFLAARRLIRSGLVDAAVVGGADTLCRTTLAGFDCLGALAPGRCNPFSRNRAGITIGEGGAAFLLSPDPGPVELAGIAETSDAHHPTAPDPEGRGAQAAMAGALADAGLAADAIGAINLHGTATPLNDAVESRAVAALFGTGVACASTKPLTGHLLGASGGVEIGLAWATLADPAHPLPPHLWDGAGDPELPVLAFSQPGARLASGRAMLSTTFGFGGADVATILRAA
jgi:3-oxoacyl-[acyl-carrier-protein] synthase-1